MFHLFLCLDRHGPGVRGGPDPPVVILIPLFVVSPSFLASSHIFRGPSGTLGEGDLLFVNAAFNEEEGELPRRLPVNFGNPGGGIYIL